MCRKRFNANTRSEQVATVYIACYSSDVTSAHANQRCRTSCSFFQTVIDQLCILGGLMVTLKTGRAKLRTPSIRNKLATFIPA
uniref:Uncharacterized protein n=1 Tax=Trichuris muris TaxID=70415 RepID=A0A5S6QC97_TRIMR